MANESAPANGPRLTQRQRSADEPVAPAGGPPFLDLVALEEQARGLLPADVFDYYAGGADTETTLAEAPAA
jgi:4-hydroxymandelate oxidase